MTPFAASSTAATWASVWKNAPAVAARHAPCTGRSAAAVETKIRRPGSPCSTSSRGRVARGLERVADPGDGRLPVGLGDLEERRDPMLARPRDQCLFVPDCGDGIGERLGKPDDARHQNFPTTKPPSTRRNSPVT